MRRSPDTVLDELLLLRCQAGDAAALDRLARRWNRRFVGLAYRVTRDGEAAHDIAQEAWVAVIRNLRRLRDPASFRSWSLRIVHGKAIDWIRGTSRRRARTDAFEEHLAGERAAADPEPDERLAAISRLRAAIAELPPDRRSLVTMFYFEEMTTREIAAATDLPEGTVKSRLFHTRKQLKEILEDPR